MDHSHILDDESVITRSNDKTVTLTNYRLRYQASSSSNAHIVSIMLEKISSIEIRYSSNVFLLAIGLLITSAGLYIGSIDRQEQMMILGLVIGTVFILIFFLTRKHIVTIASDGGAKINFQTNSMKRVDILNFINQIEKAKLERGKLS